MSASHRKFKGGAGGRGGCHTNAPGWWWRTIIIWLVSYFDKIEVGRITKALSHELERKGGGLIKIWLFGLTLFRFQSGFQVDGFAFLLRSTYPRTI